MSTLRTVAAFAAGFVGAAAAGVAVFVMAIRAEGRSQERNREASKRVEL